MNKPHKTLVFAAMLLAANTSSFAEKAPLMGWSSWNTYGLGINEDLIRQQADAMVSTGLKDAGYLFINIDDGFWNGRAQDGNLIIDEIKFPNGMRSVADYIHSNGLKAGIYSDAGDNTCGSGHVDPYGLGVGLFRHEIEDIKTYFIDWDYDFIKVDYCGGTHLNLDDKRQYTKISEAIKNCGKDDVHFNICRWAYPGTWVTDIADSWRTTVDIWDGWESVKGILAENLYMSAYCRNGSYNDMDMLEVGRSMTPTEDLTHFAMWCIMDSPLLIGCDMRDIKPQTLALLTNSDLIALNQDPLHLQAYPAYKSGSAFVLVKDIETKYGNKRAIALYNPSDRNVSVELDFSKVDLGGKVTLRDLAEQRDLGEFSGSYKVTVPAHGVKVFSAEAEKRNERTRYEAECGYIESYQELMNNEAARTAVYAHDDKCSSGMKACWLGYKEGNDLLFENVYSSEGGEYEMTIAFLSGEDREICIDINGKKVAECVANSGNFDTIGTLTVPVTLNKGENTVKLYNNDYFMPDIDYFDLTLVKAGDAGVASHKSQDLTPVYYDFSGNKVTHPQSGNLYVKHEGSNSSKIIYQDKKDN